MENSQGLGIMGSPEPCGSAFIEPTLSNIAMLFLKIIIFANKHINHLLWIPYQ